MKGAKAIVRSLEEEGVKHLFGILGGSIMEVYDVLYDRGPRHILMRHEQCAAHAAEAYARVSGKTGVCIATSGPGATNLVTGIADAQLDSSPMVAFTGQVPNHLIGNDAFQETDIIGITMPITKHNFQITKTDDIPHTIKAAFKIASTRRPGPVLVDLPKDIQQNKLTKKFAYPKDVNLAGYKEMKSAGHAGQIKQAAKVLINSERLVILAGGGVIISNASLQVYKLSESLGAPVATTLMGKGCFPEDHPLSLGMTGMHGRKTANLAISECDVLLSVGCRFSDRITGDIKHFAPDAIKIHVDIDPSEIGKNVQANIPIVGDARLVLDNLIKAVGRLKSKKNTAWSRKIAEYKKEYAPVYDYDSVPLKQQCVMKAINELIDDKTIITTEVGQCQMWAAHYLNMKHPRTFISSGGLGTMGSGFPFAIGAKVAKPDYKVIDVASDGSFLMTGNDLATCVEEKIPVVVALLNNRYLGMVKQWQDLFYDKRRSHTSLGEVPDFVEYAKSFKAGGIRIEKLDEIKPAFKQALEADIPYVLDFHIDPDEHVLPMMLPGGKPQEMIESH
ncbi:MAG: acetolactate synthase, large subunit, biosynthetic type [Candidatus Altiarchaeales archaeon ex4484_96]|nr:MAG: acetolactate synthase, large subunit, biosynthetic type [Candidatus Altiarchaeales archaeon ex4484_96]